jgi:hypothetical protein
MTNCGLNAFDAWRDAGHSDHAAFIVCHFNDVVPRRKMRFRKNVVRVVNRTENDVMFRGCDLCLCRRSLAEPLIQHFVKWGDAARSRLNG